MTLGDAKYKTPMLSHCRKEFYGNFKEFEGNTIPKPEDSLEFWLFLHCALRNVTFILHVKSLRFLVTLMQISDLSHVMT